MNIGKWFVSMLVAAFITMIFIYIIKAINQKVSIPVVSSIIEGV